jgi:hypothetical protein
MTRYPVWLILLLTPIIANGHHSNAGYDFDTIEEVQGELVRVLWQNPHVRLTLRESGSDAEWHLEAQDINSLGRRGLSSEMLEVGDLLRVAGHPLRRGEQTLYVTNVLLPNGVEIRTRGESTEPRFSADTVGFGRVDIDAIQAAADGQNGLFRVWMVRDFQFFPTDLPLTPGARAAYEAWDPANSLVERCIPPGMPNAIGIGGPHPIELTEGEGLITYRAESFDILRTIHMDSESRITEEPSPLGYSIGRWEGDALVVETKQIDWPYMNSEGSIPQSKNVETVERFRVDELNNSLHYSLTISDPETLVTPVTIDWVLEWRPDLVIEPYECIVGG